MVFAKKYFLRGPPWYLRGNEPTYPPANAGSIPGSGRSSGEGSGNPLQYSCLRNLMDSVAWRAKDHEVTRVADDLATKQQQHLKEQGLLVWQEGAWPPGLGCWATEAPLR